MAIIKKSKITNTRKGVEKMETTLQHWCQECKLVHPITAWMEQLGKMYGLYTPSPSQKTQQGNWINEAEVRWKDVHRKGDEGSRAK